MPASKERAAEQKRRLYMLLKIQNASAGERPELIKQLVNETVAEMDAEDVAYVEKTYLKK